MQERYRGVVESLDEASAAELRRWFYLKSTGSLFDAADDAGLCQADLVLRLLDAGHLSAAEHLVGRKIERARPLRTRGEPPPRLGPDDRRVRVLRYPGRDEKGRRLLNTAIYARYAILLKDGQPLRRALARGVRRKDVQVALARGYCILEDLPAHRPQLRYH